MSVLRPERRYLSGIALTCCLALALISSAWAKSPSALLSKAASQPTEVQIPVWAPAQAPLRLGALHLTANRDQELQLVKLQPPSSPTIVFVALDLSGSPDRASQVQDGLNQVIDDLPAQTWVGLIGLNGGFHIIANPTRDRSILRNDIAAVTPNGHPGLLTGIETVESIADKVQRRGRLKVAVIAVTDSDANNYRSDYGDQQVNASDYNDLSRRFPGRDLQSKVERMNRTLLRYRVPLFIVQVHQRRDPLNRIYDNALQRFCATLGGESWFSQSRAEIPLDVESAFHRVSTFYLATVRTPPPGDDVDLSWSMNGAALPSSNYRHELLTTDLDR